MKTKTALSAILLLLTLCACGHHEPAEPPALSPSPAGSPAAPTPAPSETGVISSPEDLARSMTLSMERLESMSGLQLDWLTDAESAKTEVRNIYYGILSERPDLKYAYDLTLEYNELQNCWDIQFQYMPYKRGVRTEGALVSDLQDLLETARSGLGGSEQPLSITDPSMDVDTMNLALLQVGGGYVICTLRADAASIRYSPAPGCTMEDALASLEEADKLAHAVTAALITETMSDSEKAAALYGYLTQQVDYDFRYYTDNASMPHDSTTALGALRDGLAICGGYAHAFKLLLERSGIDCINVSGTADGEYHMWNAAKIDGKWLYFDATYDRGRTPEHMRFFGVTEDKLLALNRTWNQDVTRALMA